MLGTNFKKSIIFILHAFIGWIWCGAIMGVGPQVMSMRAALIVHALLGPLGFALLSWNYHKHFNYTSPIYTAIGFTLFVIVFDFLIVTLLIIKSLDMFRSPIGTWIPFALIFLAVFLTGNSVEKFKSR